MPLRAAWLTGTFPVTLGLISWTVLPSALMIALPMLGSYMVPPLASAP